MQTVISWLSLSVFEVISTFSRQISTISKHEKLILFFDLDAEFHVLKLLFEDFLLKIIRGAGNCESLILRVKFLCLKRGGTHGTLNSKLFAVKFLFIYLFLFFICVASSQLINLPVLELEPVNQTVLFISNPNIEFLTSFEIL